MKLQDIIKLNQSFKFDYLSQDRELTREVQICLIDLKFLLGIADGIYGPITKQATVKFVQAFNLPELLNAAFAKKLIEAKYYVPNSSLPKCGVDLIKLFEGCDLKAYPDPLSKREPYTIGWGSTKKLSGGAWSLGESISQQEADELLMYQLEKNYLPDLVKIPCWGELNPNQQGALLSFGYNLGSKFYGSPKFNSMTKVLTDRDWPKISETFIKYCNPRTNVEQGLLKRRKAEAELFLKPFSHEISPRM